MNSFQKIMGYIFRYLYPLSLIINFIKNIHGSEILDTISIIFSSVISIINGISNLNYKFIKKTLSKIFTRL